MYTVHCVVFTLSCTFVLEFHAVGALLATTRYYRTAAGCSVLVTYSELGFCNSEIVTEKLQSTLCFLYLCLYLCSIMIADRT